METSNNGDVNNDNTARSPAETTTTDAQTSFEIIPTSHEEAQVPQTNAGGGGALVPVYSTDNTFRFGREQVDPRRFMTSLSGIPFLQRSIGPLARARPIMWNRMQSMHQSTSAIRMPRSLTRPSTTLNNSVNAHANQSMETQNPSPSSSDEDAGSDSTEESTGGWTAAQAHIDRMIPEHERRRLQALADSLSQRNNTSFPRPETGDRNESRPSDVGKQYPWTTKRVSCRNWLCPLEGIPSDIDPECPLCYQKVPIQSLLPCNQCSRVICVVCYLRLCSTSAWTLREYIDIEGLHGNIACPFCRDIVKQSRLEQLQSWYWAHSNDVPFRLLPPKPFRSFTARRQLPRSGSISARGRNDTGRSDTGRSDTSRSDTGRSISEQRRASPTWRRERRVQNQLIHRINRGNETTTRTSPSPPRLPLFGMSLQRYFGRDLVLPVNEEQIEGLRDAASNTSLTDPVIRANVSVASESGIEEEGDEVTAIEHDRPNASQSQDTEE